MKALVGVLLLTALALAAPPVQPGCNQEGAINGTTFIDLVTKLKGISNEILRAEAFDDFLSDLNQGFTAEQTVTILSLFNNELTMQDVIRHMSPFVLGITCADELAFLNSFNNELLRLDVLPLTVNLITDLPQNNQTLLTAFKNTFNKRDAQEIIDGATGLSCLWGPVDFKRLIFVIDQSGSMSSRFAIEDGVAYTRLQWVARELRKVILGTLKESQEFNVISFSNSATAWQPGVVPVNDTSRNSAVQFAESLRPDGGTYMLNALNKAFGDPNALAVIFLTDGEPSDSTSDILSAASAWSKSKDPPAPVNTICFGDASGAAFMLQLAEATGGTTRVVTA